MKVGLVCPYTWDVPGGVQAHVRDLAECLLEMGHQVSVLAPVDEPEAALPSYLVPAGRAVPVPYNGSVARLCFGPVSLTRTRRWLRKGRFDVLHLHEPTVPSLSMLACFAARGPMVATFHTATARSRALQVFGTTLQPGLEKITGRIAVSPAARRVVVEHLGHDAVLVPNGVYVERFAGAKPLEDLPEGPRIVFLGRIDEPRKGLSVLLAALPAIAAQVPDVQLLVAGPGDVEEVREEIDPAVAGRVHVLGLVSEADKPRVYASGDLYVAPNTYGESFGIVLIEAMAAGVPIVASDIEGYSQVLTDGREGLLVRPRDDVALAQAVSSILDDTETAASMSEAGLVTATQYSWPRVAEQILDFYAKTAQRAAPAFTPSFAPSGLVG